MALVCGGTQIISFDYIIAININHSYFTLLTIIAKQIFSFVLRLYHISTLTFPRKKTLHHLKSSTMSTTTLNDYKKPPHRRNDSGELDVFEAARYFSESNDKNALEGAHEERVTKEVRQGYLRQGRASLDLPTLKHQQKQHYYKQYPQNYTTTQIEQNNYQIQQHKQEKPQILSNEKKKHKQPNSPGGKLANFLNTLFNQTILNSKKKKTPKSTQSMKDEEEIINPISRKLRRSSMSHIRSSSSVIIDSKSMYSSSSSGFRTPPPYTINTPTKTCQTFSDYKQVLATLSKYKVHENSHAKVKDDKISVTKFVENPKNYDHSKINSKNEEKKREILKKFDEEIDEGGESDASSDLFELKIDYEFEFSTSGLPVYETTHLDNIKKTSSTPITNGLIKV